MAVTTMGISTIGAKFGYAVETTKGTKPAAFTALERCNSIAGIEISVETIDASALEDTKTHYIPGRTDPGDSFNVTFNFTAEVQTQLDAMITAYEGLTGGKRMWFDVWIPGLTDSCYIVGAPPKALPMPEVGQNELLTIEIPITIVDFVGWETAIEPTIAGNTP